MAETDVATLMQSSPELLFQKPEAADALFVHIEQEIAALVPDTTTAKGRQEIKSLAYKVARTKTAVDDAGKKLNEDHLAAIKVVNAERNRIGDKLQALQVRAREPLTNWETAEAIRKGARDKLMHYLADAGKILVTDTTATVWARGKELTATQLPLDILLEEQPLAAQIKAASLQSLQDAWVRLDKAEQDARELEKLRADKAALEAEAAAREEEARKAAIAEENRKNEEERAAAKRKQEEAEKEAAASAAADTAKRQAEAEAQRKIDAANAEAEELRRTAAAEKAQREAEAEEQRKREADVAHRAEVVQRAQDALVDLAGMGSTTAKKAIMAIAAGQVPGVKVEY